MQTNARKVVGLSSHLTQELEALRKERDLFRGMLVKWCYRIEFGSGWDYWDLSYKEARNHVLLVPFIDEMLKDDFVNCPDCDLRFNKDEDNYAFFCIEHYNCCHRCKDKKGIPDKL